MAVQAGAGLGAAGAEAVPGGRGGAGASPVEAFVARLGGRPWSQTVVADDGVPTGWRALRGGVHLRVMAVPPVREVWVLPADWVGFQPVEAPFDLIRRDGVLIAMRYEQRASHVRELIDALPGDADGALPTPPPDQPFADPAAAARADQEASALCARACPDATAVNAAVEAFVALGIPATTVFTQAVRSPDQEAALTAIRLVAGHRSGFRHVREVDQGASAISTATAVLLPLLDHAETTRDGLVRQRLAASFLSTRASHECGAALLDDLGRIQDAETRDGVVATLELIGYKPAAPAILAMLEGTTDSRRQGLYANALATLGHAQAVPVLAALCAGAPITAETFTGPGQWILGRQRNEIALLRLTASWGQPANGARLLLLPYARTTAGADGHIGLLIENLGERDIGADGFLPDGSNAIVIDGIDHPEAIGGFVGCFTIHAHDTWVAVCRLDGVALTAGRHRIGYHGGGAVANDVIVEVAGAP